LPSFETVAGFERAWTTNKKYQVFISSTFSDSIEEHQDAIRSVLDVGHIPSGMEIFPAADTEQFEHLKKVVDECDYYVLIIGARYGSTDAAGAPIRRTGQDNKVETFVFPCCERRIFQGDPHFKASHVAAENPLLRPQQRPYGKYKDYDEGDL
jgi:Domain of unknown function (DUF4062)